MSKNKNDQTNNNKPTFFDVSFSAPDDDAKRLFHTNHPDNKPQETPAEDTSLQAYYEKFQAEKKSQQEKAEQVDPLSKQMPESKSTGETTETKSAPPSLMKKSMRKSLAQMKALMDTSANSADFQRYSEIRKKKIKDLTLREQQKRILDQGNHLSNQLTKSSIVKKLKNKQTPAHS
ncbi:MAG: hypothetical protein Q4G11_05570, partial [Gallicola sp.]|nr:hypothetical protein [Gallicola sp.]